MINSAGTQESDSHTSEQPSDMKKLFVLDTNVILHDAECIFKFEEHDIGLPITVLEELDRFKKGDGDIHYQARQFLRSLDDLTGDAISDGGADLGTHRGRFRVLLDLPFRRANDVFLNDTADHRILKTALAVADLLTDREVVLVTKDTNLRLKAKSFGLVAQDYNNDRIRHIEDLYTGKRLVDEIAADAIEQLYEEDGKVPAIDLPEVQDPVANENFVCEMDLDLYWQPMMRKTKSFDA